MFTNYMRENTGTVKLVLKDKNTNTILAETSLDVAAVTPDMQYNWNMDPVVDDVENQRVNFVYNVRFKIRRGNICIL